MKLPLDENLYICLCLELKIIFYKSEQASYIYSQQANFNNYPTKIYSSIGFLPHGFSILETGVRFIQQIDNSFPQNTKNAASLTWRHF